METEWRRSNEDLVTRVFVSCEECTRARLVGTRGLLQVGLRFRIKAHFVFFCLPSYVDGPYVMYYGLWSCLCLGFGSFLIIIRTTLVEKKKVKQEKYTRTDIIFLSVTYAMIDLHPYTSTSMIRT